MTSLNSPENVKLESSELVAVCTSGICTCTVATAQAGW